MAATGSVRYLQHFRAQPHWVNTRADNWTLYQNGTFRRAQLGDLLSQLATQPLGSAAHLGLATGLLLALAVNARLSVKTRRGFAHSAARRLAETLAARATFSLLSLACATCLAPALCLLLLTLALYRRLVVAFLSASTPSFAGLLDGVDVVWALPDLASRPVINVLAVLGAPVDFAVRPPLLHELRRLISDRVLSKSDVYPKLRQLRRRSRLGYFYWERRDEVVVDEHVQYMTQEDAVDAGGCQSFGMSESVLRELVSELANSPLPCDDAACWEVLVGRDPILEDDLDHVPAGEGRRFPVLFRVHHAVGDGVALIRLLLEALADRGSALEAGEGYKVTPSLIAAVDSIPCRTGQGVRAAVGINKTVKSNKRMEIPKAVEIPKVVVSTASVPLAINKAVEIPKVVHVAKAVEIPKVVVSTASVPLAIAIGSPEFELEQLFLAAETPACDDADLAESFVVFDAVREDAIFFHKELVVAGDALREDADASPRCASPVPPFARLEPGETPSLLDCACSTPPPRFESPVPRIHRKKFLPCACVSDESPASSRDGSPSRALTSRAKPKVGRSDPKPRGRESVSPMGRNDNPIPRCNSPVPGNARLPLSRLARLRNRSPLPDGLSDEEVATLPMSTLRRRWSFEAEEAIKFAKQADVTPARLACGDDVTVSRTTRSTGGDGLKKRRWARLAESALSVRDCFKPLLSAAFAPATLIEQAVARRGRDANALHGTARLSGEKLVTWFRDALGDEATGALQAVRRVKAGSAGASFTDVLLSAVSASLDAHFTAIGACVPDDVRVVLPTRMPAGVTRGDVARAVPTLANNFSVAVLALPVRLVGSRGPMHRLSAVVKRTDALRRSADYLVNYWLMKVAASFLPVTLLAPLLDSTQSTLVVSNVVGPERPIALAGYSMAELVFWVPNRGSTGVGLSVLSYAGRLQLGLVADCTLVGNHHQADALLGGVLAELTALDLATLPPAPSRFAASAV